jgi:hypothetical protein
MPQDRAGVAITHRAHPLVVLDYNAVKRACCVGKAEQQEQ